MPKKKGNLKAALQGHFAQQEQKARERAAQEAARRKALSVAKSGGSRPKGFKRKPQSHQASDDADSPISASLTEGSEVITTGLARRKRLPQPFARDDTILIVGEANFSFTLSLLLPPRSHPPSQILATAYDSEQECFSKYPDARENVEKIRRLAGRDDIVLFGVDAGQLDKYKQVTGASKKSQVSRNLDDSYGEASSSKAADSAQRRWSKVWFGFPHVGAGHKDETRNVLANQLLILRFLISVAPYLTAGPLPGYAPGGSSGSRKQTGSDDEDDLEDEKEDDASDYEDNLLTSTNDADQSILDETQARISALQPFVPPSRQGSVLVTLRNASPYTLWDVANLAKRLPQMLPVIASTAPALPKGVKKPTLKDLTASGLSTLSATNLHSRAASQNGGKASSKSVRRYRSYHLWRSFEFDPTEWRGYQHRRTIGWVKGVSSSANEDLLRSRSHHKEQEGNVRASKAGGGECRTWEFGLG
ncbi:protein of unknown function DUF2431 [Kalmanozyma brasiliensis GHG001]|uniref:25S rRNA (uridine-N(3))-methyltransferase BMT5-like domain-containing protein n=1 Tax=Kalmanozyma brasiliensis (strain GHG001) TaxID=1365824 RepID=V5EDC2_KALBG|nr:protein of unknown function DUF2431 [Kalmanozyma brasiliensis GHG001]EST08486.1 protein of unknown function DUF2431 [Kalmanozyma brasiliensis GHG001]